MTDRQKVINFFTKILQNTIENSENYVSYIVEESNWMVDGVHTEEDMKLISDMSEEGRVFLQTVLELSIDNVDEVVDNCFKEWNK